MPAGIFARSRARPGPTKNSVYPYILGHFAHPPLRKLAKVQLRPYQEQMDLPKVPAITKKRTHFFPHRPRRLVSAMPLCFHGDSAGAEVSCKGRSPGSHALRVSMMPEPRLRPLVQRFGATPATWRQLCRSPPQTRLAQPDALQDEQWRDLDDGPCARNARTSWHRGI
jgi:hypothetical protein